MMASALKNLPDSWFNDSYLHDFELQTSITHVIPFGAEHPEQGFQAIHAFAYEFGNKLYLAGNYDSTVNWTNLYSFPLQNRTFFNNGPMWNRSLWCIGEDTDRLSELEETLHKHIKEQFGGIPIPSEHEFQQMRQVMERVQKNCSCKTSATLSRSRAELEDSESLETKHVFCNQCRRHHAIQHNGKQTPDTSLFDPNWILEETYEDVFPVPDNDNYIIYKTSDETKRIDYTVDALAWIGGNQNREFTVYDPQIQDVLVYVNRDRVAGYLSMRQLGDYDILHQIYIRPSMRGNGFATTLIELWNDHVRETDLYLLDEPNDATNSIVRQLGHTNVDRSPRALPASRIESFQMHD